VDTVVMAASDGGGAALAAILALIFVFPIVVSWVINGPQIMHTSQAKRPIAIRVPRGTEQVRTEVLAWVGETNKRGKLKRTLLESSSTQIRYQVSTMVGTITIAGDSSSTQLTVNGLPKLTFQSKLFYLIPIGPKRWAGVGDYLRSVRRLEEWLQAGRAVAAGSFTTSTSTAPTAAPTTAPTSTLTSTVAHAAPAEPPKRTIVPVGPAPATPPPAPSVATGPASTIHPVGPSPAAPTPPASAPPETGGLRSTMGRRPKPPS
jgi:hypothetical protein